MLDCAICQLLFFSIIKALHSFLISAVDTLFLLQYTLHIVLVTQHIITCTTFCDCANVCISGQW